MLIVGLTGGIASGKSSVTKLFEQIGVPIVDADVIAHKLLAKPKILQKIVAQFGEDVLLKDKKINRKKMRDLIFNDPEKKKWLEKLLHPTILKTIQSEIKKLSNDYCIVVIPLLAETQLPTEFLDRICVVDLSETLQIQRLCDRDQIEEADAKKMLAGQATREQRLALADDVLTNEHDFQALEKQVKQLHQQYLSYSK